MAEGPEKDPLVGEGEPAAPASPTVISEQVKKARAFIEQAEKKEQSASTFFGKLMG